jgi:hypothetical protein
VNRQLSNNPSTVRVRKWYARHANETEVRESLRQYCRNWRAKYKDDLKHKQRKVELDLKYRLSVRDSKEYRSKRNEIQARYKEANPGVLGIFSESAKKWRLKNPEKARAHWMINSAVLKGTLIRPANCSWCGAKDKPRCDGVTQIHAHHSDYSKPLEVEWLCASCHAITRRFYR